MAENVVYLNQAATSWPKAPGVVDAVSSSILGLPSDARRGTSPDKDAIDECRTLLATLLQVPDARHIVLTSGATHSLNLAILGMCLSPDDHVVTTVTEHNSVLRPLYHLRESRDIRVSYVGLDARGDIDLHAFNEQLQFNPKLVIVNHVSNVTGRVTDVRTLFEKAKKAGATTLLDASQSVGHIDVHPLELGADIVAFTGHKGLRGPAGTGGLYVAPSVDLEQVFVGGTGVRSDVEMHPDDMPMRMEAGTPNGAGFAGLAAALKWLLAGRSNEHNEHKLGISLREGLASLSKVRIFDSDSEADRTAIVSFAVDGWSVRELGYVLEESFGIVCRTGLHCAPLIHKAIGSDPEGTVRFSLSAANSQEDVEAAIDAVRRLAA